MSTINIPIGESDLDLFRERILNSEGTVEWGFADSNGDFVDLIFMTEEEYYKKRRMNNEV
jgi:hypothetical protein